MVLLVLLSLWSWWQIFLKMFQLKRTTRDTDAFEDEFWKGGDLAELYQRASRRAPAAGWSTSSPPVFASTPSIASRAATSAVTLDSARRAMRATYQREIDALEAHLAGLATVGSVSPVHRPLRHGLGNHECVSRTRQREPGHAGPASRQASPRR